MDANTCRNCNNTFTGRYCNNCGQQVINENDKKFSHIFEEAFHFLTHFEGSFFRTMNAVIFKPGKLTVDYCNGIRKKYYKPISFFLLLIVIYLLFPYMEGLNMRLEYYKDLLFFGNGISEQIAHKAIELNITEAELAEIFHQKSQKTAKILLLLLLPLTAVSIWLVDSNRKRTKAFDYLIAATETNSFFVLFFFLVCPLLLAIMGKIFNFSESVYMDSVFIGIFVFWLILFSMRIFQTKWYFAILYACAILVLHAIVTQIIYKTILFEITFALI